MNKFLKLLSLSLLLFTISCAHYTSERRHPQCEELLSKGNCIAVLPPKARVNMVNWNGTVEQRMYDYEYRIEDIIAQEAVAEMREKGYRIELLTKRKLKSSKSYRNYDLSSDRLDEQTRDFYSDNIAMEKSQAYSIKRNAGKRAIAVAKSTKNDLLLYINYINNVKNNSSRAVGFMMGMLGSQSNADVNSATILFRIVDGKNGHILWSNIYKDTKSLLDDAFSGRDDEADRKRVRAMIKMAMGALPMKSKILAGK